MMACLLVTLDKGPGVRPVGIGDIIWRLLTKCVLLVTCLTATAACGNLSPCTGLGAVIKGAVHFTLEEYSKARRQPTDDG